MNRIFSRVLTFTIAGIAIAASVPACAKNDKSIFIRNVLAPPGARVNGSCTYVADPNAIGLLYGKLDVAIRQDYIAVMEVGNQLISRADPADPRAESNRIHLNGVVSKVTDPNGNTIKEFTGNGTGFADSSTNNAPGFGILTAPIIDAEAAQLIANSDPPLVVGGPPKTILTQLRAFGKTLGGEDIESSDFQFVVYVCKGCLVQYDTDPAAGPGPNCGKAADTAALAQTAPCNVGQDEATSCHFCVSSDPAKPNVCDKPNP